MHPAVENLFEYARQRVTEQDIVDFSRSDPSYGAYVRVWKRIRTSGIIPTDYSFEVTEVIDHTGWGNAEEMEAPDRFRRYRRFTTSVAVALLNHGAIDSDFFRAGSYIARDLLIDRDPTCESHLTLLRDVIGPTRDAMASSECEEGYPFFTFARLILAQIAEDWPDAHDAATLLIEDERSVREKFDWTVQDDRFLLGLSKYDLRDSDWLAFARQLRNPANHPDTQTVIDALRSAALSPPRRHP